MGNDEKRIPMFKEEKISSSMAQAIKEGEILQRKEESDRSIIQLVDKYIDSENTYGPDYFSTIMLKTFVELILDLKKASEDMLVMKDSMSALDQTLRLIDSSMHFMDEIMVVDESNDYSYANRLKSKKTMKKYKKNNKRRVIAMMDKFKNITEMANLSKDMMLDLSNWTKNMTKQNKIKAKKKGESNVASGSQLSPLAQKMIDERKQLKGIPTEGSGANNKDGMATAGGIGDINDII